MGPLFHIISIVHPHTYRHSLYTHIYIYIYIHTYKLETPRANHYEFLDLDVKFRIFVESLGFGAKGYWDTDFGFAVYGLRA